MGTFGYICAGCGAPINGESLHGGEKYVLIHVRHGKEVGRTEGHYDGYGRVIEDGTYRNDENHPNCHKEICKSEYELADSFLRCQKVKMYKGKEADFNTFCNLYIRDLIKKHKYCIENLGYEPCFGYKICLSERFLNRYRYEYQCYRKQLKLGNKLNAQAIAREMERMLTAEITNSNWFRTGLELAYGRLPRMHTTRYSGTVAWHSKCYHSASERDRNLLIPSRSDPCQANGRIRKKFE